MSTRSVRLDPEAESALEDIVNRTGLSISDAIKQGLIAYREKSLETSNKKPADFFNDYDLGEGGYALGPARDAKRIVKERLQNRQPQR